MIKKALALVIMVTTMIATAVMKYNPTYGTFYSQKELWGMKMHDWNFNAFDQIEYRSWLQAYTDMYVGKTKELGRLPNPEEIKVMNDNFAAFLKENNSKASLRAISDLMEDNRVVRLFYSMLDTQCKSILYNK